MELVNGGVMNQNQKAFQMHLDVTEDRILQFTQKDKEGMNALMRFQERFIPFISGQKEKERFFKVFEQKRLLEAYQTGDFGSSFQFLMEHQNRKYLYKLDVELFKNDENGHIEALIGGEDSTLEYLDQSISRVLFHEDYKAIGVISLERNTLFFRSNYLNDMSFETEVELDYQTVVETLRKEWIEEGDRPSFGRRVALESLSTKIPRGDHYSFVVYNRKHKIERYSYTWMDDSRSFILFTVEDLTREMETDYLTGYPNRRGFYRKADQILAQKDNRSLLVLFINIIHFKAVNDLLGRENADGLLRQAAVIWKNSNLKPLVLARLEADYFALLVDEKNLNYEELPNLLHFFFEVGEKKMEIYCRCGIYEVPKDRSVSVAEMITKAKLSKNSIINDRIRPFAVYREQMREEYMMESEVLSGFERALEKNEFCAYYQPIYDAKTEQISMAEALVRWRVSENRMISPGTFIPTLEKSGYITKLDVYINQSVVKFIMDRVKGNKDIVPISVNMSRMDLMDRKLLESMRKNIIKTSEINHLLRYEITESAYADITEDAQNALKQFKTHGVKIWVDDFGSGVSSFSTIMGEEFDLIKMDMEFVRKIGGNEKINRIIIAIIDMAHSVDMKVIAEGVETREQAEFLRRHGCDYLQGYYYAKPMPQEQFEELLDSQREGRMA